jgi:hypothetical protein
MAQRALPGALLKPLSPVRLPNVAALADGDRIQSIAEDRMRVQPANLGRAPP